MQQKVDIVCLWIGPHPLVAAFSAESVRAILDSNQVITKGAFLWRFYVIFEI